MRCVRVAAIGCFVGVAIDACSGNDESHRPPTSSIAASTTTAAGGSSDAPGCTAPVLAVLDPIPTDVDISTQAVGSTVSIRLGIDPGDDTRWIAIDTNLLTARSDGPGSAEVPAADPPGGEAATVETGDGPRQVVTSREQLPVEGEDDHELVRYDWIERGVHVSVQAFSAPDAQVETVLGALRFGDHRRFADFQVRAGTEPVCS